MNHGRLLKLSLKIAAALALLVLLSCFCVGWFFSSLLLQPGRAKELKSAWAKTSINAQLRDFVDSHGGTRFTIPSEFGYDLAACYVPSLDNTRRTAVLVHGFADRKEKMIPYAFLMRSLGYNVLLYDHRNCGESGGKTTTMGYYEQHDLATVVRAARERSGRGSKIVVLGVSMGAATALLLAGNGQPGADLTIADSGYSDFPKEALHRLGGDYPTVPAWARPQVVALGNLFMWLRSGAKMENASPIRTAAQIKTPVLFISTGEDDYVPREMTNELYLATRSRKMLRIFDKGAHTDALELHPFEYRETVMRFLKDNGLYEAGPSVSLTE